MQRVKVKVSTYSSQSGNPAKAQIGNPHDMHVSRLPMQTSVGALLTITSCSMGKVAFVSTQFQSFSTKKDDD